MNLFTRLSEILDGEGGHVSRTGMLARFRSASLVKAIEKQETQVRQSAVALIAAERAVVRELGMVRGSKQPDPVLLERLLEEHGRAIRIKSWLKQTLLELGEGLRQAGSFRAAVRRWECLAALRQAKTNRHRFWRAYERLGDLTDERLESLGQETRMNQPGGALHKEGPEADNKDYALESRSAATD